MSARKEYYDRIGYLTEYVMSPRKLAHDFADLFFYFSW